MLPEALEFFCWALAEWPHAATSDTATTQVLTLSNSFIKILSLMSSDELQTKQTGIAQPPGCRANSVGWIGEKIVRGLSESC
jgi:hypothetical protein